MSGIGIVTTTSGKVSGVQKDGITVFRSLPYAEAPVGALRFRSPRERKKWSGVRKCDTFGSIPYQPPGWVGNQALIDYAQNEDCLTLNIWTPARSSEERLPVLVWIHGGGFMGGVSHEALYDGTHFAKKGIVVVSISYRLGVFGFLALPELRKEADGNGNFGLLDQIFALKWIRRNIAAFGGDPYRVTIDGQSAGAMSVASLCTSPLTHGLISGAIMQSSGPQKGRVMTLEEAEENGLAFMKQAGLNSVSELREADPAFLRDLTDLKSMPENGIRLRFQPVVDGSILPERPYDAFVNGRMAQVPMIIGNNSDEGFDMNAYLADPTLAEALVEKNGKEELTDFRRFFRKDPQAAARMTTGLKAFLNHRELMKKLVKKNVSPVYHYFFSKQTILTNGLNTGASHSAELFYVFYTLPCMGGSTVDGEPFLVKRETEDYFLSDCINDYRANFVKTGDPNGAGLAVWEDAEKGAFMHFDHEKGVLEKELKLSSLTSWKASIH